MRCSVDTLGCAYSTKRNGRPSCACISKSVQKWDCEIDTKFGGIPELIRQKTSGIRRMLDIRWDLVRSIKLYSGCARLN